MTGPSAIPPRSSQAAFAPLDWLILLLVWALATLAGLLTRPMIPVDELRYATVAWEMWSRGDFLVPYLNGAAYSHKPPLFFWLIHAGWGLFGVSEGVVRMVAPLLCLLDLLLCTWLARLLWPNLPDAVRHTPMVLLSCIFLTGFFVWVQMDLLLVAGVLLALCGVALAAAGRAGAGWLVCGAGLGLGLLAKGPVVLVHVLPLTWLAPIWLRTAQPRWPAWYGGSLLSLLLGAALVLAWAIPAALAGGEAYREAIFWGQTANRMVQSFAHAHPAWWYLPWLLVLFAPWVLLPWLWSALRTVWQERDRGTRFCLVWLLSVVLLLSLVSGKQVKYLLPVLPAFALLVSRALATLPDRLVTQRPWLPAGLLLLLGTAGAAAPFLLNKAQWLNEVSPLWGVLLVALGLVYLVLPAARAQQYPLRMLVLSLCVIVICEVGVMRIGAPAYDLRDASRFIAEAQAAGRPVAIAENYHGQFGFYGRLTQPLVEIEPALLLEWTRQHPDGYVVMTGRQSSAGMAGVTHHQPYRSGYLAIVSAALPAADLVQLPISPLVPEHERYTLPE